MKVKSFCSLPDVPRYPLFSPSFISRKGQVIVSTLHDANVLPLSTIYLTYFHLHKFRYEKEQRGRRTLKAQQLWYHILESQTETGTPYMLYKDACNRKSNQKNLGTIKCSNLCTEIVEYTSADEVRLSQLIEE